MKFVYLANAYGHISGPLCDKLHETLGDNFVFISTEELSEDRKKVGSALERNFIIYLQGNEEKVQKLCDEADVLIYGHAPIKYIANRIKENKLTIYYSERLFKGNLLRFLNPITIKHIKDRYITPSKNSNFHLMCASSFAAHDFNLIGAFRNKMYKWGYQPTIIQKDIDTLLSQKPKDGLEFIWVGRLVKLKHCDDAIKVIGELVNAGYNARMTIIGTGPEEQKLKNLASSLGLDANISFLGRCNIEKTRSLMDNANIFMFTSDLKEGWGVTLNECMNSGVACVASHLAGSTNFLTQDGKNALVYKSGDIKMLYEKVKRLIDNKDFRESIAREGYKTIYENWNPDKSYKRMLDFINELKEKGTCELFEDGPCSKAEPLSHNWYKG